VLERWGAHGASNGGGVRVLPKATPKANGVDMRHCRLSEIQRDVLRVSCRRCERTVEIQTVDAVRLYSGNAIWKTVAQRFLDDTCQQRTGRHEEDGCWPALEKPRLREGPPALNPNTRREGAHPEPQQAARFAVRPRLLIGVGSRRRSASQAIDLPSDGGGNLGRLFTTLASMCSAASHL
jgi:hypothetical protein